MGNGAVSCSMFAADGPAQLENGEPFAYGILLEDSDAHVANLTIQGPADDGSDPAVSGVYVIGGAPLIEGIDVILSGDRFDYAEGAYYRRSAVRVTGGSTATVRDSTWDGYVRMSGVPNAPTFEGNTITGQHIAVPEGGQEPIIRGNTFLEGAAVRWDSTGSGGLVEDNDITGWIGVDEYNDPIVRGNRIRGGGALDDRYRGAAIGIASGATPLVEGNEIEDSAIGIYVTGFARRSGDPGQHHPRHHGHGHLRGARGCPDHRRQHDRGQCHRHHGAGRFGTHVERQHVLWERAGPECPRGVGADAGGQHGLRDVGTLSRASVSSA